MSYRWLKVQVLKKWNGSHSVKYGDTVIVAQNEDLRPSPQPNPLLQPLNEMLAIVETYAENEAIAKGRPSNPCFDPAYHRAKKAAEDSQ